MVVEDPVAASELDDSESVSAHGYGGGRGEFPTVVC